VIFFSKKILVVKEIPNTFQNITSDRGPMFFLQEGGKTIRTSSFGGT
jgi:hypothetical protein